MINVKADLTASLLPICTLLAEPDSKHISLQVNNTNQTGGFHNGPVWLTGASQPGYLREKE